MNFEELIIIERIYIRRRWWQEQSNYPTRQENPGGIQRPNFPDNDHPEGAQNFLPIENEGNFKMDLNEKLYDR